MEGGGAGDRIVLSGMGREEKVFQGEPPTSKYTRAPLAYHNRYQEKVLFAGET